MSMRADLCLSVSGMMSEADVTRSIETVRQHIDLYATFPTRTSSLRDAASGTKTSHH